MANTQALSSDPVLRNLGVLLSDLEALYKDVHSHPELSMQETRTAGLAADRLRAAGYEVTTGVGRTGVVGLFRNGDGPTVMLRADMDALPIQEATGLAYASKATATDREGKTVPVAHMCGHDIHVTWLAGATKLMAEAKTSWRGTLMAVFQPAEETGEGAQAMIDDGLFKRFPKPDVILGQHVMVGPSGTVAGRPGAIVFRYEGGVLAEPIARSLDLDNNGVVKQAIKQCCGDDGITKDLAPFSKAAVRSEDHRALFIAGVDQLEEQIAATGYDREVTDLVDDKKGGAGEEPQALAQSAFALGFCEDGDDVGERGERDALSRLYGLDRECRREMALASAGRPKQTDHLGALR
jgi:hypothetical protein